MIDTVVALTRQLNHAGLTVPSLEWASAQIIQGARLLDGQRLHTQDKVKDVQKPRGFNAARSGI